MLKKFNDKFNSLPKGVQFVLAIGYHINYKQGGY